MKACSLTSTNDEDNIFEIASFVEASSLFSIDNREDDISVKDSGWFDGVGSRLIVKNWII